MRKLSCLFVSLLLAASSSLAAEEKALLRIEGAFLAYSYDHNQIYGENVTFPFSLYAVSAQYLKADILSRSFYACGEVILRKEGEELRGDELLFDPAGGRAILTIYRESIEILKIGDAGREPPLSKTEALDAITLARIRRSFLSATAAVIEVTAAYEVIGSDVMLFVEGLESVGFKKLKLSIGDSPRKSGFSLNKVWFSRTQGLLGRASYLYEAKEKATSFTQINYEEHSILANYSGLARQVDLTTSTSLFLQPGLELGLAGNYNSSSLWNTRLWLGKKWNNDRIQMLADFVFNKPVQGKGEAWLGLQTSINAAKAGNLFMTGRYAVNNQVLANIAYRNILLGKLNIDVQSSYSQVRSASSREYSKILTGNINVSYNSRVFSLATDYYLNADLIGSQRLSQPQLRVGLNPWNFYGGLLTAQVTNIFIFNSFLSGDARSVSYSNNIIFNILTQPIYLQETSRLRLNVGVEQFLEKEGRNFTSPGLILNLEKSLIPGISLEGFYSLQSRRRTRDWLIEGTTSQDLSAVLKLDPGERVSGWVSLSYDPKENRWRQSFADLSLGLLPNWKLQSLLHYDFLLKKINNVDLYLIREAGRFDLRFIWRSLSRQFLVEFVPK